MIITIDRKYGSGGRMVGEKLAKLLGYRFYDRELLKIAARESGMHEDVVSHFDERPAGSLLYSTFLYATMPVTDALPLNQKLAFAQFDVIRRVAQDGDCVIVGRCADYVLKDLPHVLHVHIFAPEEQRFKNCVQKLEMEPEAARRTIARVDRARELYHQLYGGGDVFTNCHVMLNSSQFGVEGTARILEGIARDTLPVSKP